MCVCEELPTRTLESLEGETTMRRQDQGHVNILTRGFTLLPVSSNTVKHNLSQFGPLTIKQFVTRNTSCLFITWCVCVCMWPLQRCILSVFRRGSQNWRPKKCCNTTKALIFCVSESGLWTFLQRDNLSNGHLILQLVQHDPCPHYMWAWTKLILTLWCMGFGAKHVCQD